MTVAQHKAALRAAALERRARTAAALPAAGTLLAAYGAALPAARVVSAYVPMRGEIDPMPLAAAIMMGGAEFALPALSDGAMGFRLYVEGDTLIEGPFGTREPTGPPVVPDLVLVPLLAFDRAGGRLGYGAGYYDGWLAAHPDAFAVGLAYAAQEVPAVPREAHDQPLDVILTERERIAGVRRCG